MASSLQNSPTTIENRHGLQEQANKLYTNRKVFQDLIHGKIELHPVCVRIINTPQFHRLRHIKQIGTCYYVYPTACHNRFEHSIGVCYLAGKLVRKLKERQPDENITDIDILCVEIAGLCHDLGQGPFSHVFEKKFMPEMGIHFSHKATARKMFEYMLECGDGTTLKEEIQNILKDCHFPRFEENDFEFIKEMIDAPKDISTGAWPYRGRTDEKSFLYEIVANDRNGVDVDKWDYLARDSHMLGLHMTLDYERCFTSARVIQSNGANGTNGTNDEHAIVPRKQICYREKDAIDLYDMFYARLNLHRRAYQHKTHTVIGLMICDALKAANDSISIGGKKIAETVDDMEAFTLLTDDVLQLILNKKEEEGSGGKDESKLDIAYQLIQDIMNRRLYKCVSQTHCRDKKLTKADVLDGLKYCLKDKSVSENFIIVDVVEFNYGMENKNPLDKVRFYNKYEMDRAFKLKKEQVSYVLPDTFEESIIRIYCNKDDFGKEIVCKVTQAFEKWCKDNRCTDPEGKFHQTKPKIAASYEPEGSNTQVHSHERTPIPIHEPASADDITGEQPSSYDRKGISVRTGKFHQTKPKIRASRGPEGSNTHRHSDERTPIPIHEPVSTENIPGEQPPSYDGEGISGEFHQTKPKVRVSNEADGSNTQGHSDERTPKPLSEPASADDITGEQPFDDEEEIPVIPENIDFNLICFIIVLLYCVFELTVTLVGKILDKVL